MLFVFIKRRDDHNKRYVPLLASVPVPILPDAASAGKVEDMLGSMLDETCSGVVHTTDTTSWLYSLKKKQNDDHVHHPSAGLLLISPKYKRMTLFSHPSHVMYITYTLHFSPICADLGSVLDAMRTPSLFASYYLREAIISLTDNLIRIFRARGMPCCCTMLERWIYDLNRTRREAT
jgi:hypothetical protein